MGMAMYELLVLEQNREGRQDLVNGLHHMTLCIYNLCISLLSPAIAVAYAVSGSQLVAKHDEFHNGRGPVGQVKVQAAGYGFQAEAYALSSLSREFAQNAVNALFS